MKFYKSLIPYCEEYGIKVAVENMWQYPGMISHSTCSRPEEFIRYIDELDSIVEVSYNVKKSQVKHLDRVFENLW